MLGEMPGQEISLNLSVISGISQVQGGKIGSEGESFEQNTTAWSEVTRKGEKEERWEPGGEEGRTGSGWNRTLPRQKPTLPEKSESGVEEKQGLRGKEERNARETFGAEDFAVAKQPTPPRKTSDLPTDTAPVRRHKTPPKLPDAVIQSTPDSVPLAVPSPKLPEAQQTQPKRPDSVVKSIVDSLPQAVSKPLPPETPKRPAPVIQPITPTLPGTEDTHPSPSQLPLAGQSTVPQAPVLPVFSGLQSVGKSLVPNAPVLSLQSTQNAPMISVPLAPALPLAPSLNLGKIPAAPVLLKPGVSPAPPGFNLPKPAHPSLQIATSKLKPVRIESITPDKVKDTIWEKAQSPTLLLDDLEQFFGRKVTKVESDIEAKTIQKSVSLLFDERRTRAFDMAFSRVKKLGIDSFERHILEMNSAAISDNLLETLRTVVPTLEERNAVLDNTENVEKLNSASQLLVKICAVPRFATRLTVLKLKRTARGTISEVTSQCELVLKALAEVRNSERFTVFLASVLRLGNALNAGTQRANAAGIKLTCLPQVLGTKDNSGKETLLSYLIRVLLSVDPGCLQFPSDLPSLRAAGMVVFEQVEAEAGSLKQSMDTVAVELSRAKSTRDDHFVSAVESWFPPLSDDIHCLSSLVASVTRQTLQTAIYLGEDSSVKMQPDDLFKLLQDVCDSVQLSLSAATSKLKRR